MADLQMTNMAKSFGPSQVFKDFSLSIEDGEFLVLVGPSGCGKSTLLRMIAGLEPISEGDMRIGGRRVNNVPPQKRGISMVFQSYALFPHMSVRGNIAFGPRVRGEDRESMEGSIQRASEILGLDQYIDRKPAQLSGGQRQRVATGRSIVRNPQVFLFDEPLSNLDAKLRVQMRTEIKALHQKLGTTIVYVTHDQIEAMTMADRIVVMNEGRIEQIGTPLELYDRPANVFVGGFIGSPSMSFLDGRYENTDRVGGAVILDDETVLPVSGVAVDNGTRLKIGIRPEAYVRDEDGPIALTVEVVEPTGPEIHISGIVARTAIRAVFRERLLPGPGETIRLSVPSDQIHLFDAANGQRLRP